jgi:hypothetical protein
LTQEQEEQPAAEEAEHTVLGAHGTATSQRALKGRALNRTRTESEIPSTSELPPFHSMAPPSRPLMRGIRPPRVFPARGGRVSPYAVALTALLVASAFLLALIAFGVFSLPISAPNAATTVGGDAETADAHPARPRVRRDLG